MAAEVEAPDPGAWLRDFLDFIQNNAAAFWAWLINASIEHPILLAAVGVFVLVALWIWSRGRRPKE